MKKLLLITTLLFTSFQVYALTPAEKEVLKTAVLAEEAIASCLAIGNDVCIADWLNTPSSFIVWRTSVNAEEYHNSAIVWTAVDGLTNGKARIWEWLSRYGSINPSKSNVRQGFADAFGGASATTTASLAISKRSATKAEELLATGTGTNGTPGLLTFEGEISLSDVSSILRD